MAFVCDAKVGVDPRAVQVSSAWSVVRPPNDNEPFLLEDFIRGRRIPCHIVPNMFFLEGKRKKIRDICFYQSSYWVVTRRGKDFFEEFAPGDCEFCPTEIWRYRRRPNGDTYDEIPTTAVDTDCYLMNPLERSPIMLDRSLLH